MINEVLANNASGLEDGRTPDWVELYNGTTNTLNLADYSLTDDTLQPRRFVFAAGVTMSPGAYLRVLCDPGSLISGPLGEHQLRAEVLGRRCVSLRCTIQRRQLAGRL